MTSSGRRCSASNKVADKRTVVGVRRERSRSFKRRNRRAVVSLGAKLRLPTSGRRLGGSTEPVPTPLLNASPALGAASCNQDGTLGEPSGEQQACPTPVAQL